MNIHFVGIGGIGVSSLARYFLSKGDKISGSDRNSSEIIQELKKEGIEIAIGSHSPDNLKSSIDLLIYTPAALSGNPEIKKAKRRKIKTMSYPEALGELTKDYFTIAVSGTHGKSTTTAMLSLVMIDAGLDPTVIIGTKLKEFDGKNFRKGKSKYLLIEADEYKESFLNYHPNVITITNIDKDHLDYYKNFDNIIRAFSRYFKRLLKGGVIIANGDDKNTAKVLSKNRKTSYYSQKEKEALLIKKIIKIPGEHNISNALAAFKTARFLGISSKSILKSLSTYRGCWRRFEIFKTGYQGVNMVSDYAHHPIELEKTLAGAREKYPKNRIIVVFQPHQHNRTTHFFDDFVRVLSVAPVDKIFLLPIFGVIGRNDKLFTEKNSSKNIAKLSGKNVFYKKNMTEMKRYLLKDMRAKDLVMVIGAGDINNLFLDIKRFFLDKKKK